MSRLSEWLMGWQRVARFTVIASPEEVAVEKTAIKRCRYALPSVKYTAKPRTPPEEELRFWLAYHCKAMRYIDAFHREHSLLCRSLLTELADYARQCLEQDWMLFDPVDFAADLCGWSVVDNVASPVANWSGDFLAKRGHLRVCQTVFQVNIDPMCITASSCAFLKQAVIGNNPHLITNCLQILDGKMRLHNPVPLSGAGIANATWIEAVMSS